MELMSFFFTNTNYIPIHFSFSLSIGNNDYLTFIGTGDFTKCKKQVESMFFTNCSHSSCGTLGEYQPEAHGQYMVIKYSYSWLSVAICINGVLAQWYSKRTTVLGVGGSIPDPVVIKLFWLEINHILKIVWLNLVVTLFLDRICSLDTISW